MVKIYSLKDPITLEIKYIGKTIRKLEQRLAQHYHSPNRHNYYNACWINSLKIKELKPIIELIDLVSDNEWEEKEIYWIKYYRDLGFKLTNYLDGGKSGMLGKHHTDEAKAKISRKGKEHCWYSRKHSQESKDKISQSVSKLQLKPIYQIDINTNQIIKLWNSLKEAKEVYGKSIGECARGKTKNSKGYIWRYK